MAITPEVLKRLAELNELRVEALNTPSSPNELQVFQVRLTALYLSVLGDLIPTDTVLEAVIPVTIKVQWQVEDLRGVPLSQEEAVVHGQDLQATVMGAPDFVELSRSFVPTTKTRYLSATAELSCNLPEPRGGTISVRVPLSRYPITVACVPIPTVALCFHSANLGMVGGSIAAGHQFILVAVPADSPLASVSALRDACSRIQNISKTANQLLSLVGLLPADGLTSISQLDIPIGEVIGALDAHKVSSSVGVSFVAGNRVEDLNTVDAILGTFNNIEAEDEISSLVLIGPPGRRLAVFQHVNFGGRRAIVEVGDYGLTVVRRLDAVPPSTEPAGKALQSAGPTLDNRISSYAFL